MTWYLQLSTSFNAHWMFPAVLVTGSSVVLTSWSVSKAWQEFNYITCKVLILLSLGCYLVVFSDLTTQFLQTKIEAIRQNGAGFCLRNRQVAPVTTDTVISVVTPSQQVRAEGFTLFSCE